MSLEDTLPDRRKRLSEEARIAIRKQRINTIRQELERRITNAGLSDAAKDRLREAFMNSTNLDGLRQAINVEKGYDAWQQQTMK